MAVQTPRSKLILYPYYVMLWGTFGCMSFHTLTMLTLFLGVFMLFDFNANREIDT
jgi:hypothetical protein